MKYKASIQIMPLPALLDPQGKAVSSQMKNIGLPDISGVRIGKNITLEVEAQDAAAAENMVKQACEKLLVNKIMEHYAFSLEAQA
jgi:phosphoribosylformylglycinamidine synthase